jgi:hypothetical protein
LQKRLVERNRGMVSAAAAQNAVSAILTNTELCNSARVRNLIFVGEAGGGI